MTLSLSLTLLFRRTVSHVTVPVILQSNIAAALTHVVLLITSVTLSHVCITSSVIVTSSMIAVFTRVVLTTSSSHALSLINGLSLILSVSLSHRLLSHVRLRLAMRLLS